MFDKKKTSDIFFGQVLRKWLEEFADSPQISLVVAMSRFSECLFDEFEPHFSSASREWRERSFFEIPPSFDGLRAFCDSFSFNIFRDILIGDPSLRQTPLGDITLQVDALTKIAGLAEVKVRLLLGAPLEGPNRIPPVNTNSRILHSWARVFENPFGDAKTRAKLNLALYWDTFRYPLRYFNDRAAAGFLTDANPDKLIINTPSYRKDYRGWRASESRSKYGALNLKGPSERDAVITPQSWPSEEVFNYDRNKVRRFNVSISRAGHHGFNVEKLFSLKIFERKFEFVAVP